jgi:hypothetical protein
MGTWMLGFPDRAVQVSDAKDAHARRRGHPFDLGRALVTGSWVWDFLREPEATEKYADALIALAADQGFPFFTTLGAAFRSLSVIQQGKVGRQELA